MKIVIELEDTVLGGTNIKCSVPWSELQHKRQLRVLTPGAEALAEFALRKITESIARRQAPLIAAKPRVIRA